MSRSSSSSSTCGARTTRSSATSGWPRSRIATPRCSTASSPSTSRSSCRSSTRRPSAGRARSSATSSAGRAGRGSRRPTATGSRSSSARARTWTSGSSSSPTTSGSSVWAIRAPAGWPSRIGKLALYSAGRGSIRPSPCRSRSTSGPTTRPSSSDPLLHRPPGAASAGAGLRRARRGVRRGRRGGLAGLPHPVGGLQAAQRAAHPRPLPGTRAVLQRRHPGDRRDRRGRRAGRPARPRVAARRRTRRARRGGRSGHRDRAPAAPRDARGRRAEMRPSGRPSSSSIRAACVHDRREDLDDAKRDIALPADAFTRYGFSAEFPGLVETIERVRPTVLVGTTAVGRRVRRGRHLESGRRHRSTHRDAAVQPDVERGGDPGRHPALDGRARRRRDRLAVRAGRGRRRPPRDRPGQQRVHLPGHRAWRDRRRDPRRSPSGCSCSRHGRWPTPSARPRFAVGAIYPPVGDAARGHPLDRGDRRARGDRRRAGRRSHPTPTSTRWSTPRSGGRTTPRTSRPGSAERRRVSEAM